LALSCCCVRTQLAQGTWNGTTEEKTGFQPRGWEDEPDDPCLFFLSSPHLPAPLPFALGAGVPPFTCRQLVKESCLTGTAGGI